MKLLCATGNANIFSRCTSYSSSDTSTYIPVNKIEIISFFTLFAYRSIDNRNETEKKQINGMHNKIDLI